MRSLCLVKCYDCFNGFDAKVRTTKRKLDQHTSNPRINKCIKEAVLALRSETALVRELRQSLAELSRKRKEEGQAAKRVGSR